MLTAGSNEHKQFVSLTFNALRYLRLFAIGVQKASNTYGIIIIELLCLNRPRATAAALRLSGFTVASHHKPAVFSLLNQHTGDPVTLH